MKIIGFGQLRNEIERGNLKNWFDSMDEFCDYIYIYDQNSDDGSKEFYKQYDNCVVIESPLNDFENELKCKQTLLNKIREDHSDCDWILWMDGDTLMDGRLDRGSMEKLVSSSKSDGINFGHLNLWRSDTYYRIDNSFHSLNNTGVTALWKNEPYLNFDNKSGVHKGNKPLGFKNIERCQYDLIHRGFATDKQIIDRLESWKHHNPKSWNGGRAGITKHWNRFFDESTLSLTRMNNEILPKWFNLTDDTDSRTKKKLIELYKKPSF